MRTLLPILLLLAAGPVLGQGTPAVGVQTGYPGAGQVAQGSPLPLSLPFSQVAGLILIQASVGDGQAGDAVLATALPVSLVSPALVAKQSLRTEGFRDVTTFTGTMHIGGLKPQPVRLGRVVINDVPFGVDDHFTRLSSKNRPDAPSIWLGTSTLAAATIMIDPTSQQVLFLNSTVPLPAKATKIPFELKDGRIYVDVKLSDKKTVRALVDTASVGTLLPSDIGKALKLPTTGVFPVVGKDGKKCTVTAVELPELALANAKVKNVQAIYVSEGDAGDVETANAVIGTDVLLRYRVTISYSAKMIALEPLAQNGADPRTLAQQQQQQQQQQQGNLAGNRPSVLQNAKPPIRRP